MRSKSRIRIKKDEKANKTDISYFQLKDNQKKDFRFHVLNTLIKDQQILVIIDTNLCCLVDNSVPKNNVKIIEKYINEKGYKNIVVPIENTNKKSVFGMLLGTKNKTSSYKLAFVLPENEFNRETFDKLFNIYDIGIGIGLKKDIEETFEDFRKGYFEKLFDHEYLENNIFVGIMFDKIITDIDFDESIISSYGK